ncbi:MAG: hypothetical protein ACD_46C00436G0004 [uncultured bacterium]|nr:MAG: hypothetical protein ACD_46C00436G0004 [uncultured bacterium]
MLKVGQQFGQHYSKNSVHIVKMEQDCQHLYSLFFDLEENDFLHWIINNGNLLTDFIDDYNVQAHDTILESKANENRIVLPNSIEFDCTTQINTSTRYKFKISVIHKSLHIPVHLSYQQSQCLRLLLQGKSAKKIALLMQLSHRTIEHYLERIRKQLGCSINKEVVAVYGGQIAL